MSGRFAPGHPKPANSGRKAGTLNVLTREVKAVLERVLAEPASEERLRALRDSDSAIDRATFWRLAGRLIPVALETKGDGLVKLTVIDFSDQREDDPRELAPWVDPPKPPLISPGSEIRTLGGL